MEKLNNIFKSIGVALTTYVLDNETSQDLMDAFEEEKIAHQVVSPHHHRTNRAERAIQTDKAHFKSCLSGTDPNFPLSEWDRILPQAKITLNLLPSSRTNPRLSACAYVHGKFDYREIPMAPPGTKFLVH